MKHLALAALLALASPTAFAADWIVEPSKSKIEFDGAVQGAKFDGAFKSWTAKIRFDPADLPQSNVTAVIDMGSAGTGDSSRDSQLPTSDWFDTKKFPQANFATTEIRAEGPGAYHAKGNLTIRGVTVPVELPFTLAIDGAVAKMNGKLDLDRGKFGVGQGSWSTGDVVAMRVGVTVTIEAKRAP